MNTRWNRSWTPGHYVSDNRRYTAELRPAGFYTEFDCKLHRHYAIRLAGHANIIGTARTLAEATRLYLN